MIITRLQGGLGNQLFQWATSYSLSKKLNCDYFFDLTYYKSSGSRPLDLSKISNLQIKEYAGERVRLQLVKDNFEYTDIKSYSYLDGYWQTEKYFKQEKATIKSLLSPTPELINVLNAKYKILEQDTVSLHVRRGDYVGLQTFHPLQSIEYYAESLSQLSYKNVLVFSDDIDWCKKNLKFKNCSFSEETDNITEIYLMSLCKDNIIANSSFSWWGAWLNKNDDKRVIAPKNWFGSNGPSTWEDIYCDGWTVI